MISYYVHFAYGDAPRRLFLLLNFFCYILSVIRLSYPPSFLGFFLWVYFHFEFGEMGTHSFTRGSKMSDISPDCALIHHIKKKTPPAYR